MKNHNDSIQSSIDHDVLQYKKPPNRSSLRVRWVILPLLCVVMMGSYYSLDIPASIHQQLNDYMSPTTNFETKFNLLFSLYSLPNIVLPFFGGYFVDTMGSAPCVLGFVTLSFVGQLITSIGISAKSWAVVFLGRTIFGFGGESLCVAQSALLAKWFDGGEVALAFGISLSVSRLGSVFNNMVSPAVANATDTPFAFWIGTIVMSCSVIAALIVLYVDDQTARKCEVEMRTIELLRASLLEDEDGADVPEKIHTTDSIHVSSRSSTMDENVTISLSDARRFGTLFWLLSISCVVVYGCVLPFNNVASGILLERNYFKEPPDTCTLRFENECTSGTLVINGANPSTDENGNPCPSSSYSPVLPSSIHITRGGQDSWDSYEYVFTPLSHDNVDCGDPFWSNACTKDYCDAQNDATEKAGRIMSIPYTISAVLSPFLGFFVDKFGRRAFIAFLAPCFLLVVHLSLGLTHGSPVIPLIGQGIAYALYAAVIWPSVPLTVEAKLTGTAYGTITAIQNIGLAFFPLFIAAIYNSSGEHYIPSVELFFAVCALFGAFAGILLNIYDRRKGRKLNSSSLTVTVDFDRDSMSSMSSLILRNEGEYI